MTRRTPPGGAAIPAPETGHGDRLLDPGDPPPYELVNPAGSACALLVCDHASNRIPRRLGSLGLAPHELAQHIAWDPGAAGVARGLAARLDAPLLLGGYSRLVIDLNRPLVSPESIAEQSARIAVPGNRGLNREARAQRVTELFEPYHRALAALLDERMEQLPLLISIHSFTPELHGEPRPWHAGVAYGRDPRLAHRLFRALGLDGDLTLGLNQPYGVDDEHDYTLPSHGESRGILHVMIEMRQDCIALPAGVDAWSERLARAYKRL